MNKVFTLLAIAVIFMACNTATNADVVSTENTSVDSIEVSTVEIETITSDSSSADTTIVFE
jgi:hypothetical protein